MHDCRSSSGSSFLSTTIRLIFPLKMSITHGNASAPPSVVPVEALAGGPFANPGSTAATDEISDSSKPKRRCRKSTVLIGIAVSTIILCLFTLFFGYVFIAVFMGTFAGHTLYPYIADCINGVRKRRARGNRDDQLPNNETRQVEDPVEGTQQIMVRQTGETTVEVLINEKPVRFTSQEIENFTSKYSHRLGKGGFGVVYKGQLPDGVPLAVKVLNNNGVNTIVEKQFFAEINTLGRTYHRNLVRLYGFCFDSQIKALIYEYLENGSLDTFLFGEKPQLEWEKLYQIAIGAAKGLEYLHHHTPNRIVHYDIKPANVLLDSSFCAKLADFGLAKLCSRDSSSTNITISGYKGTPGYAAPELYMPFNVSQKCDVYSFGTMLFEIVGRRRNLRADSSGNQDWFPRQVWESFDKGEIEELMVASGMQEKDMEEARRMSMVALWCVQYLPKDRPSISSVVQLLEGGADVATPPNPFRYLESSFPQISLSMEGSSHSTAENEKNIEDDNMHEIQVMQKEIEYLNS